jgi:hypothetical protein
VTRAIPVAKVPQGSQAMSDYLEQQVQLAKLGRGVIRDFRELLDSQERPGHKDPPETQDHQASLALMEALEQLAQQVSTDRLVQSAAWDRLD